MWILERPRHVREACASSRLSKAQAAAERAPDPPLSLLAAAAAQQSSLQSVRLDHFADTVAALPPKHRDLPHTLAAHLWARSSSRLASIDGCLAIRRSLVPGRSVSDSVFDSA